MSHSARTAVSAFRALAEEYAIARRLADVALPEEEADALAHLLAGCGVPVRIV
ncbi:hypothetical protein [Streptomyces sp. A012304]|uniref:hypothetical protein n=1 Tax=Streptomyces sp. A012304 TaxID=375446 RepID=UPI0022323543|nr:hypothetical protein [Streptomyces sp. A012304]GKQ40661.1 hypothetical protein ALMP_71840 [Streptomyces sp. A012304]